MANTQNMTTSEQAQKLAELNASETQADTTPAPFQFLPTNGRKHMKVALSELMPLDSIPVKGATEAMRQINTSHRDFMFEHLKNGGKLPALKVALSNYGILPYDGNHRWSAYEKFLAFTLGKVDAATLAAARKSFMVDVEPRDFETAWDLLQASYTANYENGLPTTEASRSVYGWALYTHALEIGQPISIRKAGEIALVSHVAIIKYRDKLAADHKIEKMAADSFAGTDEAIPAEDQLLDDTATIAERAMRNILANVKKIAIEDMDAVEVANFVRGYAENADLMQLNQVITILNQLRLQVSSLPPKPVVQKELKAEKTPKPVKLTAAFQKLVASNVMTFEDAVKAQAAVKALTPVQAAAVKKMAGDAVEEKRQLQEHES